MITEKQLIDLADTMAAAASQMGQMGYEVLMDNRDQFKQAVHELYQNFDLKQDS